MRRVLRVFRNVFVVLDILRREGLRRENESRSALLRVDENVLSWTFRVCGAREEREAVWEHILRHFRWLAPRWTECIRAYTQTTSTRTRSQREYEHRRFRITFLIIIIIIIFIIFPHYIHPFHIPWIYILSPLLSRAFHQPPRERLRFESEKRKTDRVEEKVDERCRVWFF